MIYLRGAEILLRITYFNYAMSELFHRRERKERGALRDVCNDF